MTYNKYKANLSKEKFFKNWTQEQVSLMSEEQKNFAYAVYELKCDVFNRDSFTCQNEGCKYCKNVKEWPKLTVHHIKHKRNGGEDKLRNCVLICKGSHSAFNRGKDVIKFGDKENLPPHIRGHTFRLHVVEEVNWKEVKKQVTDMKREIKLRVKGMQTGMDADSKHWFNLTMEQMIVLMKFLDRKYIDYENEE